MKYKIIIVVALIALAGLIGHWSMLPSIPSFLPERAAETPTPTPTATPAKTLVCGEDYTEGSKITILAKNGALFGTIKRLSCNRNRIGVELEDGTKLALDTELAEKGFIEVTEK